MADGIRLRVPNSLLARTNLILAVSAVLIAASATFALNVFVIDPIRAQSADDEAALLVLSAQTWVELPGPVDARELLADAMRAGVLFAPGHVFQHDGRSSNGLRLTVARMDDHARILSASSS